MDFEEFYQWILFVNREALINRFRISFHEFQKRICHSKKDMNIIDLFHCSYELIREIVLKTHPDNLKDLILSNSIFIKSLRPKDSEVLHRLHFEIIECKRAGYTSKIEFFKNPDQYAENLGKMPPVRHGKCCTFSHDDINLEVVRRQNYRYGILHGTKTIHVNGKLVSIQQYDKGIACGIHMRFFEGVKDCEDVYDTEGNRITSTNYTKGKLLNSTVFDKHKRILETIFVIKKEQ